MPSTFMSGKYICLPSSSNFTSTGFTMIKTLSLSACAAALLFAATGAMAAPSDDAETHFRAIGNGDLGVVMRAYADTAQLNWVGGPLDGTYASADAIRGTWEKFTKSQGPLKVSISKLEESANPKGATISANVLFEGKAPIKVRYVLTIREGKIVNETWQIDPKMVTAMAAPAPAAAAY
jgi:hypothetical protein